MKNILTILFNYTTRQVRDMDSLKLETATYFRIFGFVVKTIYKPL